MVDHHIAVADAHILNAAFDGRQCVNLPAEVGPFVRGGIFLFDDGLRCKMGRDKPPLIECIACCRAVGNLAVESFEDKQTPASEHRNDQNGEHRKYHVGAIYGWSLHHDVRVMYSMRHAKKE